MIAAIADGVSGSDGGREAAEYAVRGLLADYYATPDTWDVTQSLDRVLTAMNRWLLAQGTARPALAGMATTLTALVLRGSLLSRPRRRHADLPAAPGRVLQLTQDHVWDRPDMHHVLKRAIGLDRHLLIDHADGEVEPATCFCCAATASGSRSGRRA